MSTGKTQHDFDAGGDRALVHAAKQGDMAAFGELVTRHSAMILRVAMHIVSSPEDAEDIAQEAFLKAFQNLHRFEERALFSTWVTRIAVNGALMRLRSFHQVPTPSMGEETDEGDPLGDKVADWRPNPEQFYNCTELRAILKRALTSVPHDYRIVFLLRDVEGISVVETAEMLSLTVPVVQARLFRALLKLRDYLSPFFEYGNPIDPVALIEHRPELQAPQ